MAYAAKGELALAEKSLAAVKAIEQDSNIAKLTIWDINHVSDLVQLASLVLEGEIAYRKGKHSRAIQILQKAVAKEDLLNYNEPPDWFFSVRHILGHVMLQAGQFKAAEMVYRRDLETYKNNGWALMGLYQSLINQPQKSAEAAAVKNLYQMAWKWADKDLLSSVL